MSVAEGVYLDDILITSRSQQEHLNKRGSSETNGRGWNASETGEVHLPHPRRGALGAQDLLEGPASN